MSNIFNPNLFTCEDNVVIVCPWCEVRSKIPVTYRLILNKHKNMNMPVYQNGTIKCDENSNPIYQTYYDAMYMLSCDCGKHSVWISENEGADSVREERCIYPPVKNHQIDAHKDTPESIKPIFEEAVSILDLSPRSSAALTRLALEKLCDYLGATPSKNLNNKIQELIDKGLDPNISYIFDGIRIFGNDGAHDTGLIDLNEKDSKSNSETLLSMFNYIVEDVITRKKKRTEFVNSIPKSKIQQIEERGKKN
ncbi:DUF4145 domain-containing protein [Enterococcus faecalis]|uniref:DUF4145 domain-containing protein n=1 Tax=Enterococcus faecalis TaxID=1351 RepID=UPI000CF12B8A|nr:DUF4145 domain-containing protein [Enterococcus faecalis]EGO8291880.1 DUF4145 domain-containing protein [Enterococcus faecalis]EKZ0187446.1 DUF4145 domain-containing protein [Enterococcus faecalis]ELZ4696821.1 DUF4145 domain-containing protein [Enterococcus faecalis]PQD25882.1 hypothetical protein CUM75_04360 [Enterococcus faecalis]PQD34167.1 hypothetical protein CUM64_05125 [Enterococcus faecalis]